MQDICRCDFQDRSRGEIDALDPAGYGAVTITKAITIDGGGGQVASVLVSGTNGIVINANASTDVVILRNLRINGIGSGSNGNPVPERQGGWALRTARSLASPRTGSTLPAPGGVFGLRIRM